MPAQTTARMQELNNEILRLERELKASEKARAKLERELANLKRSLGLAPGEAPEDPGKLPVTIPTTLHKPPPGEDVVLDTTKNPADDDVPGEET